MINSPILYYCKFILIAFRAILLTLCELKRQQSFSRYTVNPEE